GWAGAGAATGGAGGSIGAAAANVSASASSEGVAGATAMLAVGSGFGSGFAAEAFLGGTSFTVTVFTFTGVMGAFEPGTTTAVASLARGGIAAACSASRLLVCAGGASGLDASATCTVAGLVEACAMCSS